MTLISWKINRNKVKRRYEFPSERLILLYNTYTHVRQHVSTIAWFSSGHLKTYKSKLQSQISFMGSDGDHNLETVCIYRETRKVWLSRTVNKYRMADL